MKFRNMYQKYYAPAGDDGSASGGSATPPNEGGADDDGGEKSYSQAEVDALVNGLKGKNSELLGKLKEQKAAVSDATERLKQFDGIDPESVRTILKRFSDDEEAKLIAEGKIDEVLEKRTEMMRTSHEKDLQALQGELEKAQAVATKFTDRVLADSVRAAGSEAGIHKAAFEDAIYRAKGAFEINSDGEIIAKDGKFDSDGKPLTPKAWFEGMKEQAPHWFPAPQGGGMSNNATGNAGKGKLGGTKAESEAYWASKFNIPLN